MPRKNRKGYDIGKTATGIAKKILAGKHRPRYVVFYTPQDIVHELEYCKCLPTDNLRDPSSKQFRLILQADGNIYHIPPLVNPAKNGNFQSIRQGYVGCGIGVCKISVSWKADRAFLPAIKILQAKLAYIERKYGVKRTKKIKPRTTTNTSSHHTS